MVGSSHLARTYLPMLDQLVADKGPDEQQDILEDFRGIVGPIVLAANPLSATSLASLLGTERYDVHDIMDILNNLHSVFLVPSKTNEPVNILHLSFRDFLIDHKRADKEGFWIDETETHNTLLACCLRRLEEDWDSKDIICSNARPGTRRIAVSAEQISGDLPPHMAYACCFWPKHLVGSGQPIFDGGPVHQFLQQHFLHWLEALSWLSKTYSALTYIDDLLRFAKGDDSRQVFLFLTDAKRFVRMHQQVLDLAPLQIYHSAMIFTPSNSIVRKTFDGQIPGLWEHLPKVPAHWSVELSKLEGHDSAVTAVVFSPDGL
nr:vegetative incompatibility protein het-e-1 [Quercus suber]